MVINTINELWSFIFSILTDPSSFATILTGGLAIFLYKNQLAHEKRNAAIMLILEIRSSEQKINIILDQKLTKRQIIYATENWEKHKHLFASDLSHDDFVLFNRFFEALNEISQASQRSVEIFYSNLSGKASAVQEKLISLDKADQEYQNKRQKIIETANSEEFVFEPNEPISRIIEKITLIEKPSNTLAFAKLKKIAKIN